MSNANEPADAALADALIDLARSANYVLSFRELETLNKAAAALRARPQAVAEGESYSAEITAASDFRITAAPDLAYYVLQWRIIDGTIMTVTSIKISREGLAHTLRVIDRVRELLPLAASQSATGGAT